MCWLSTPAQLSEPPVQRFEVDGCTAHTQRIYSVSEMHKRRLTKQHTRLPPPGSEGASGAAGGAEGGAEAGGAENGGGADPGTNVGGIGSVDASTGPRLIGAPAKQHGASQAHSQ